MGQRRINNPSTSYRIIPGLRTFSEIAVRFVLMSAATTTTTNEQKSSVPGGGVVIT
jgi:hypothetical protein